MATKLNIENLMLGSEAWWHQQSAVNHPERAVAPTTVQAPDDVKRQQLADMRQPNPQMPTRTRGGGYRQPGMSEGELADFQAQGNGEVYKPKDLLAGKDQETREAKAMKMANGRAGGVLPEQKPVVDHTQRAAVDASKGNPDNVNAIQQELGLEGGSTAATQGTGTTYNGYDDILKLMRYNAVSDAELARRQRSREIVAGLGDTISAIANMWATTKGAPNSYDNSKGMSATAQERYARMLAERKAQHDQILNYYRVKRQAEQEKENQEYRNSMLEIRRQEAERRQNESDAKIKREDDIAKARQNALEAQQRKNDAETIKKRGENQYAITYWSKYGEYRQTMDHEEADRRANADAAAAEQEVLNQKEQREERKTVAAETRANKTGSSKSKKGKQAKKKVAPKRKVRQNASIQSQSSGGDTMPGVK